mmetsp:Transcript_23112/g.28401  ORF Transcript_23112/g.28401 Transcript_23112/m.28401 type:complete len:474 (-) Transcript_23112:265-1686(-)
MSELDLSKLRFRWIAASDVDECYSIERLSYPADEAASLQSLRYRQGNAGDYFLGAYSSSGQILGFVCGTLCKKFDHDTMSVHDSMAHILAIHSVVITPEARRKGIANAMLCSYIRHMTYDSQYSHVTKLMLICKQNLLRFYIGCGFVVTGLSDISHGATPWIECEMDLCERRKPKFWVVDAFTETTGGGNPAAVVITVNKTLYENRQWSQTVAAEFNLSETVFVSERESIDNDNESGFQEEKDFDLKYFSPTVEIQFCGHATLAAAYTLFVKSYVDTKKRIIFHISNMSPLIATMSQGKIVLDFPLQRPRHIDDLDRLKKLEDWIEACAGVPKQDILRICDTEIKDLLVEISIDAFRKIEPKFSVMKRGDVGRGIIIACAGDVRNKSMAGIPNEADFSSRFFAPGVGIDEDPVTGSAHCTLAPYFAERLHKTSLVAWQDSRRGGSMFIDVQKERNRVTITAAAVISSQGTLCI